MSRRLWQIVLDWLSLLAAGCTAAIIGIVIGAAEAVFALGLQTAIRYHQMHWMILTCLLPLFGAGIVWIMQKYGGLSKEGINLVFEVSQGLTPRIPKRVLILVTLTTWLSHLAGASSGREGVAVQIGASISDLFRRKLPRYRQARTLFLVTGIAAGFAGLFGTPYTAVFFALELFTAGKLEMISLLPALSAAFSASAVGRYLGIYPAMYRPGIPPALNSPEVLAALFGLGVCFGLCGGGFAWLLHTCKKLTARWIQNPVLRVFLLGIPAAALLLFFQGRYSSTGTALIEGAMLGKPIYPWDFAVKMVLTVWCLSVGFTGGEVMPLFTVGFCLGFTLGELLGLDPLFCGALGFAAVFGAGTNTWLAAVTAGMELFGYHLFPYFFIVCSVSCMFNHHQSIYSMQKVLYARDICSVRLYDVPEQHYRHHLYRSHQKDFSEDSKH